MSEAARQVICAFERETLRVPITDVTPVRSITPAVRRSAKYAQIAASIAEVGIIEPPVIARDPDHKKRYILLDGHIRLAVLRDRCEPDVVCLVATVDEAFTYNRRVNRLATIQEHKMILNAVKRGVPEERLARALNLNISSLRNKANLTDGICPEAISLLKDKHVPINTFSVLKRLKPLRQIEAAELMVAMNQYSTLYAESLAAASAPHQLVQQQTKRRRKLSEEQAAMMARESENLEREFRAVEDSYGRDHLDLVLALAYVNRLLENARVVRHLSQHHAPILAEFSKLVEPTKSGRS